MPTPPTKAYRSNFGNGSFRQRHSSSLREFQIIQVCSARIAASDTIKRWFQRLNSIYLFFGSRANPTVQLRILPVGRKLSYTFSSFHSHILDLSNPVHHNWTGLLPGSFSSFIFWNVAKPTFSPTYPFVRMIVEMSAYRSHRFRQLEELAEWHGW